MIRAFWVDTPLGRLKVWAKHFKDNSEDYPGVYVDLERPGKETELLACIEYDSNAGELQTCVYQPGVEGPTSITVHELNERSEAE